MKTPKPDAQARRPRGLVHGQRTNLAGGKKLLTHQIGALPILNRILKRMRLHEFLQQHLPTEDKRTKLDTSRVLLLLLRNLLVSREPIYGVAQWACNFSPDLFALNASELMHLNDDRIGRSLQKLFEAIDSNLIMDVVTHVVQEFNVRLDELHNDSTTVTFTGDYADASNEQTINGHKSPAILWGHNKDHRPDLKQLLYILTVTEDGGVPIYFQAASGNVTDDQTHQATWQVMAELVGRTDFVYVADCKLATSANMNKIAQKNGRFITVLPATRKEDAVFRQQVQDNPSSVSWDDLYQTFAEDGSVGDTLRVCQQEQLSKEGYRLLWFHSRSKAETDTASRAKRLQRAGSDLTDLRSRLSGSRTRFRTHQKVIDAVETIVVSRRVKDFLKIEIQTQEVESFRQVGRGRPSPSTKYIREVQQRFGISWELDTDKMNKAASDDGVFPLITNLQDWDAQEVLRAYKRQPLIENRFSQFKSDFHVAPVYLKSVSRIVGLLAVYFFALMVQSLLEREMRLSMAANGIDTIALYPEGRPCARPTTRGVLDVFEPISLHTLFQAGVDAPEIFSTELAPIHKTLLKLLRIPVSDYRR